MKKILKAILLALLFLAIFAVGAIMSFVLTFRVINSEWGIVLSVAEIVASLLLSNLLSIVVHESGHLVFGLTSGYSFSSFRIFSFMLLMQDGRLVFRRQNIAGTGGQCLMIPPEGDAKDIPVILYNLGGSIFNLLLALISVSLYFIWSDVYFLSVLLLLTSFISGLYAFINGIPMNVSGMSNDGMNAVMLNGNEHARIAFLNQLKMCAAQAQGIRVSNMPDDWFELPDGADMNNVHCATIAVFKAERYLDAKDLSLAERSIESLLRSNYAIIGLHRNLLVCDLVFCRLINHEGNVDISNLLTLEQLKFMKNMGKFPSILRTQYCISLLRDKDENQAGKVKDVFEKQAKKYPFPAEIKGERELMEFSFERYNELKSKI